MRGGEKMSDQAKELKKMMEIISKRPENELRAFCSGLQLSGLLSEDKNDNKKPDKKPA